MAARDSKNKNKDVEVKEPKTEEVETLPVDDLSEQLTSLGLSEEQINKLKSQGAETKEDMALIDANDIQSITNCGLIIAKKIVKAFECTSKVEETVSEASPLNSAMTASYDILPSVPEDAGYLEMLKIGGVLKIQPVDVISAMRAAIASSVNLYGLPDIILARMEQFAREQDEPVGAEYYKLQKMITQRSYADVLTALDVPGNFISEKKKKDVLERINTLLWPALIDFHDMLSGWVDTWSKGMANPGMALSMLAMATGGGSKVLPPGMMAPPETEGLRDEAEAVINRINKVFAVYGIPVARALGYDATRIRAILEEPTLPAAVGATTRDQMIKSLGVSVGAEFVRLERNAIRYALAIMDLPKVSSGNEELSYLGAMYQLGMTIPWDKLSISEGTRRGTGSTRSGFRDGGDDSQDLLG